MCFGQPPNFNYFLCYIFHKVLLHTTLYLTLVLVGGEEILSGGGGNPRLHETPAQIQHIECKPINSKKHSICLGSRALEWTDGELLRAKDTLHFTI